MFIFGIFGIYTHIRLCFDKQFILMMLLNDKFSFHIFEDFFKAHKTA